jgi:hypothetical protein
MTRHKPQKALRGGGLLREIDERLLVRGCHQLQNLAHSASASHVMARVFAALR